MCNSFDMACRDAESALQLNIKVNSEDLLPNSQKYNVGSLRLPADPSWPKIPQRRLADDLGEIIEPPCVVTLTGTPRKSRTAVRVHHRSPNSLNSRDQIPISFENVNQRLSTACHPLKRRPGCADPRFKRVTTVKSQMTPNDSLDCNRENHPEQSRSALVIPNQTKCSNENIRKIVPEKDTDQPKITQREAEKPGEIRGMDSVGVQTISTEDSPKIDSNNQSINVEISKECEEPKKIIDDKNETEYQKLSKPSEESDEKIDQKSIIDSSTIDEKNCDKHEENETSIDQKEQKIFYSKDENSLKNSAIGPNTDINAQEPACLQYCQGSTGKFLLVVDNNPQVPSIGALQIDRNPVTPCNCTTQCYNVQVPVLSYQNLPLRITSQSPTKLDIPGLPIESSVSLKNATDLPIKLEKNYEGIKKIDIEEAIHNIDKDSSPNTPISKLCSLEIGKSKITDQTHGKQNETSSASDCDISIEQNSNFDKNNLTQMKKKRRSYEIEYSRISSIDRDRVSNRKMKSEQNLPQLLPFGGKRYKNISEPRISVRGACHSSGKFDEENRFANRIDEFSRDHETTDFTSDDIDSDVTNAFGHIDTHRTDISNIEETKNPDDSTTILPVKTQRLLNKSYMEYYDKMRSRNNEDNDNTQRIYAFQTTMGAPQVKKRRDEIRQPIEKIDEREESGEILTLEKLSALSNMINRNLNPVEKNSNDTTQTKQLYVNENMKSSSDPTAGTESAVLRGIIVGDSADPYDSSVHSSNLINKVKRKREKPVERKLLKLKTIAFFGFTMYAMIVLLPMMYNYLMHEDYEDYEDLSYIELTLEYVISSFREAFGGLFDVINDIFLRPRACRKCNNAA